MDGVTRDEQIRDVYDSALKLPPVERARYVESRTADDAERRARILNEALMLTRQLDHAHDVGQ